MASLSNKLIAGTAAGLAGTLAMDAVSALWASTHHTPGRSAAQQGTRPDVAVAQQQAGHIDTATEKTAAALTARHRLTPQQKERAGKAIHYTYGATMGAAYALLTHQRHPIGYSLVLWAGGILVALPALGLAAPPQRYRASQHALGILGHLAYGATLGLAYRALR